MDIDPKLGQRLKARREALGLSVFELAVSCGVEGEVIDAYEAGRVPIPAARLRELADLLEVPPAYFQPD